MVYFDKQNEERIAIYVQFAFSVQKGHINYTVPPKEAYRPQYFFFKF